MLLGCQKDEIPEKEPVATEQAETILSPAISYYRGKEAQGLINDLKDRLKQSSVTAKVELNDSITFDWGSVDESLVMEVVDDSIISTTFKIVPYESYPNGFFNLVMSEKDGQLYDLKLYGYMMSPDFANAYHTQGVSLDNFEGAVLTKSILSDDSPCDRFMLYPIGNVPCLNSSDPNDPETPPGDGSPGSGAGYPPSPPSTGTGDFNTTYNDTQQAYYGSDGDDSSTGGNGENASFDIEPVLEVIQEIWEWLTGLFGGNDCNCPHNPRPGDEVGGHNQGFLLVGTGSGDSSESGCVENIGSDPCTKIAVGILGSYYSWYYVSYVLGIDHADVEYLRKPENKAFFDAAINYLLNEEFSAEALAFFREALEAYKLGAEVDFEERVIYDDSFLNTETKCIHDKLKNGNTFYGDMIEHFNNPNLPNFLIYEMGNAPAGDWAITSSYSANGDNLFLITADTDLENKSNLAKMVTLSHELIHAYMFDFLEDVGIVVFDNSGAPILNLTCPGGTDYNNINLNTLSIEDRFIALICAMDQNGTISQNWTHELFNSPTFEITDYRQTLEQFLLSEYDWNNETTSFKNNAINVFGIKDWKIEVSKAVSWLGLEGTAEYTTYLNNYTNPSDFQKLQFIIDIENKISTANSDCP